MTKMRIEQLAEGTVTKEFEPLALKEGLRNLRVGSHIEISGFGSLEEFRIVTAGLVLVEVRGAGGLYRQGIDDETLTYDIWRIK